MFGREARKQAELSLNKVLFDEEVRRLIKQEVARFMAGSPTDPPMKEHLIGNLKEKGRSGGDDLGI